MEQEHPIPQQISAYQFRLVGDMTIKQFFQVAGGALIALLIYSSGLAPYVKWPLIIISFLAGVAFAFFPLGDRPLSKWLVLFLKAIYSPTLYIWKQEGPKNYFAPEPTSQAPVPEETKAPVSAELEAVLVSAQPPEEAQKLEQGEQEFLTKVTQHFSAPALTITSAPPIKTPQEKPIEKGREIKVPVVGPAKVEPKEKPQFVPPPVSPSTSTGSQVTPSVGYKSAGSQVAQFSEEAAPPAPATKPNVIVGQVLDSSGKIVDGAILEIKDTEGRPVRALKTNRLGHFMIVTPLANGKFEIITEKEGLSFPPVSFEAKGAVIPPIAIKAA